MPFVVFSINTFGAISVDTCGTLVEANQRVEHLLNIGFQQKDIKVFNTNDEYNRFVIRFNTSYFREIDFTHNKVIFGTPYAARKFVTYEDACDQIDALCEFFPDKKGCFSVDRYFPDSRSTCTYSNYSGGHNSGEKEKAEDMG